MKKDHHIYHGTGKGSALGIQREGFMKLNRTGEKQPSISFTNDLDYAKYYAIAKGGFGAACILRVKRSNTYQLSDKILNNNGCEYITFKKVPSTDLEILTPLNGWKDLNSWDVVFNEIKL
tara:strand:+ start:9142 stop:9501 length:360 start_codon:yes stop_codon:yes gene_type:complete